MSLNTIRYKSILMNNGISVIMPTYNQSTFINSAILSLKEQTFKSWELIIINDGSTDNTSEYIKHHLNDSRVRHYTNKENEGIGVCLNQGIRYSKYENIAYLPSDDIYFKNHLLTLYNKLQSETEAILVYSGIKYNYQYRLNKDKSPLSIGIINGTSLQLVQVLHKKTKQKWKERNELVTDDLFIMFWQKLSIKGSFLPTNEVSCEWISHPRQHHKLISKVFNGGISSYREHYKVKKAIKFQSTAGEIIDENQYYKTLKQSYPKKKNGLKILIVGELAYNPERILALEEQGNTLFGLWIKNTRFFYTVGPLPFGNIIDISQEGWVDKVKEICPDIIYAQLNSIAVDLAYNVLKNNPGIPFVWHFKESPFFCRAEGTWEKLIELYYRSDGQIYINQLVMDWFNQFIPPGNKLTFILDGDLPKNDWFKDNASRLLSSDTNEIHTALIGRPVGFTPEDIALMAKEKIHCHFYGNYYSRWKDWILKAHELAPGYLHIHPNVTPDNWVKEFSKYDAGWLHSFESCNDNELQKMDWHDLNIPARIATLAASGLPMIQYDNSEHLVATQMLTQDLDIGIFFRRFDELGSKLRDKKRMSELRENVWKIRSKFTFDYHVPNLISFFNQVIQKKNKN